VAEMRNLIPGYTVSFLHSTAKRIMHVLSISPTQLEQQLTLLPEYTLTENLIEYVGEGGGGGERKKKIKLMKNHPHLSNGVCTVGQNWPQYQGT
jgi:hypothetical protein